MKHGTLLRLYTCEVVCEVAPTVIKIIGAALVLKLMGKIVNVVLETVFNMTKNTRICTFSYVRYLKTETKYRMP